MRVAIAGTAPVELEALQEAWKVFGEALVSKREETEFVRYSVSGEVKGLARSVEELLRGARSRAENLILQLKREKAEADFYVGAEGGFEILDSLGPRRMTFLTCAAYVTDGFRGGYGHGPGILVPAGLADPVIDRGIDLAIAYDRFAARTGVESEAGIWGLLTRDVVTTRHAFVLALLTAFAPFYSSSAYGG
jgi:non-canonical (house-cleaning) NTP pyrophosphatase